ncbi:MAG: alpha/beta fold hydrolase [Steroidobacteraceae bacterium]
MRSGRGADWVFRAGDRAILDALAGGGHRAGLREYFGARAHAELSRLATAAAAANPSGPRVLILPGIMGSRLGAAARGGGTQVLWIDPVQIHTSGLMSLALPAGRDLRPQGVLLYYYAKLLLSLRSVGCDAEFYPYDWRLGLDELGAALALHIKAEGGPVSLVAHSMGGLVARMAVGMLPKWRVRRLIMLGTPNFGSFGAVQAIRGTYPFVRKVARLDPQHSPEFLAENVFCSFPGLYQLLPPRRRLRSVNLYDPAGWPAGAAPNSDLLSRVAAVRAGLCKPDSRMAQILGINRLTVIDLRRKGTGFEYKLGLNGDGSVPLALARLPGLPTYFVDESHSRLANNAGVIQTVIDLIRRGRSLALPRRWTGKRTPPMQVHDEQLCAGDSGKIDWRKLSPAERASLLAELYE